jgi:hypothetical protein
MFKELLVKIYTNIYIAKQQQQKQQNKNSNEMVV